MEPTTSNRIKRIISFVILALGNIGHSLSQAAGETDLESAISAADDHRYAEAFRLFIRSASEGNLVAQRSAAFMAFYGSSLYGDEIPGNHRIAKYWASLAARQGCEVSQRLMDQISKHGY